MRNVRFTIFGLPKTWARVKTAAGGHKYKPKEVADFQNRIRDEFIKGVEKHFRATDYAVMCQVIAYFPIPISMPKYRKEFCEDESMPFLSTPDIDNLQKNIFDALQYLAFANDSRVSDVLARKRYSPRPRMDVDLWFLDPPNPKSKPEPIPQLNLFQGGPYVARS
jgi:Holliday junction resolvase RusA-like endonuclease